MNEDYIQYAPPIGGLTEGARGVRGNQRYEITLVGDNPVGLAYIESDTPNDNFSFNDTDRTVSNALVAGNATFVSETTDGDDTLVRWDYLDTQYTVRYTDTQEMHILGTDSSVTPFYTLTFEDNG